MIQNYELMLSRRLRFQVANAIDNVYTYQNILDTIGMASNAATLQNLFNAVRVRKLEVWASDALGLTTSIMLGFNNNANAGLGGDFDYVQDNMLGVQNAYIKHCPKPNAQAGQFQRSSAQTCFYIKAPVGSIIDLSVTMKNLPGIFAAQAQNAAVGLTTGVVYYRGLDGLAAAGTNVPPAVSSVWQA